MEKEISASQKVFDRTLIARRKKKALSRWHEHDFLRVYTAERLLDRILDVKPSFPRVLNITRQNGEILQTVEQLNLQDRLGKDCWVETDFSSSFFPKKPPSFLSGTYENVVCDEEALPFAPASFDLVIAHFNLHWINDVPGFLRQISTILSPDGLFLAVFPGEESLKGLRDAWFEAEIKIAGGASPRVFPMIGLQEAAALLQRGGFALPVADLQSLSLSYENGLKALQDLKGFGESNALLGREKTFVRRDTFLEALALWEKNSAHEEEGECRYLLHYDLLFLTAWAPAPSQQKPLRPGSAKHDLKDFI